MERRMAACEALTPGRRVEATDIEARIGARYTADTLAALRRLYPGVRFVWLMGADNLVQFHLWDKWKWIMQTVPVGVLARPGERLGARRSVAARTFRHARIPARASHLLARAEAPAWCFLNVPMVDLSSTALRARGLWQPTA